MYQRVTSPWAPAAERLAGYNMLQAAAGVEDVEEIPSCDEASSWAEPQEVYPGFLFDDAAWAEAVRLCPALASPADTAAEPAALAAAAAACRRLGLGVEQLMDLPKGAPRMACGLALAQLGLAAPLKPVADPSRTGFTAPALGGGEQKYDPHASDYYLQEEQPLAAPPQVWLLGKPGSGVRTLGSKLAEALGAVPVSVKSAMDFCLAQGIDVGIAAPPAPELAAAEAEAVSFLFKEEGVAAEEGIATAEAIRAFLSKAPTAAAEPAEGEEPAELSSPPLPEWLAAVKEPFVAVVDAAAAKDTGATFTEEDFVAARLAVLQSAAAVKLAKVVATAPPEVLGKAVVALLTSAEATHRGYLVSDIDAAVHAQAVGLAPSAVLMLDICDEDLLLRKAAQRLDPQDGTLYTGAEVAALQANRDELQAAADAAVAAAAEKAAAKAERAAARKAYAARQAAADEAGEDFDEEAPAESEEEEAEQALAAAEEEGPDPNAPPPPPRLSLETASALVGRMVLRAEDEPAAAKSVLSGAADKLRALVGDAPLKVDATQNAAAVFAHACFKLAPAPAFLATAVHLPEEMAGDGADPEIQKTALPELAGGAIWSRFRSFCPVSLTNEKTLTPGLPTLAAVFKGELYIFAEPAKQLAFLANPRPFIARRGHPAPPPQCVLIVGPPGCGAKQLATTVGEQFGLPLVSCPAPTDDSFGGDSELEGGFVAASSRDRYYVTGADLQNLVLPVPGAEPEVEPEAEPEAEAAPETEPEADAEPVSEPVVEVLTGKKVGWVFDGAGTLSTAALQALLALGVVPDKLIVIEEPPLAEREDTVEGCVPNAALRAGYVAEGKAAKEAAKQAAAAAAAPELAAGVEAASEADGEPESEPTAAEPEEESWEDLGASFDTALQAYNTAAEGFLETAAGAGIPVTRVALGAPPHTALLAVDPFRPAATFAELPAAPAAEGEDGDEVELFFQLYGQTKAYCPVSLRQGALVLGKAELCALYRERYYVFAGEAERDSFLADPHAFIGAVEPTAPPLRVLVRGSEFGARAETAEYLSATHDVPIFSLRDELANMLAKDPKPAPSEPEAPYAEPDAAGEAEAEPEPEAETEPPVWQDFVQTYLDGAPPTPGVDEGAVAVIPADVFLECVTKVLAEEPFASQGYVWEADAAAEPLEQLELLCNAKLGPEIVLCVDVEPEVALARAPPPVIPHPTIPEVVEGEELGEPIAADEEAINAEHAAKVGKATAAAAADAEILDGAAAARPLSCLHFATPAQASGRGALFAAIEEKLRPHTSERMSIFADVRPLSAAAAAAMLASGAATLSRFGKQCPVTLLHRCLRTENPTDDHPAAYRHQVFYLAGPEERDAFVAHPLQYVSQAPPLPQVCALGLPNPPASQADCLCWRR
jgi:hypothetical protein